LKLRVGILGGTFDPVHNAHLALAAAALQACRLDRILWIPTGTPPYRAAPVAAAADRLAMLKLGIAGEPRHAVDERELAPAASGYTVDTVLALREENPGTEFVLFMGADQYARRASWKRWPELEKLCRIAVAERPDAPPPEGPFERIPMARLPVSASEVRARLARGEDVSGMLPAAVLRYIKENGLYC